VKLKGAREEKNGRKNDLGVTNRKGRGKKFVCEGKGTGDVKVGGKNGSLKP